MADSDQKDLDEMEQARDQLAWLNQEAGLNWSEIADRLDVARSTVSRWVNEHHDMTPRSRRDVGLLYQQMRRERGMSD